MTEINKQANTCVVLINYNGYDDTIECVNSLRAMCNAGRCTIVVVDNCSTDNSYDKLCEVLKHDAQIVVLRARENKGFSAGNNIGIHYALNQGADYIWLLNNDTIVDEKCLTNLIAFAEQHPRSLLSGKIYEFENRATVTFYGGAITSRFFDVQHIGEGKADSSQTEQPMQVEWLTGCCFFGSTDLFSRFKMDEKYFLYYEDLAFSLELRKHGIELWVTPTAKLWHKGCASTGKLPLAKRYYLHRNKLLLISKFAPRQIKIIFYLLDSSKSLLKITRRMFKGVLLGNAQAKNYALYEWKAIRDFWLGRFGKIRY